MRETRRQIAPILTMTNRLSRRLAFAATVVGCFAVGAAERAEAADVPATYAVQSGDTLSAIAGRHAVSLMQLTQANPQITNPHFILPKQQIVIPAPARLEPTTNESIDMAFSRPSSRPVLAATGIMPKSAPSKSAVEVAPQLAQTPIVPPVDSSSIVPVNPLPAEPSLITPPTSPTIVAAHPAAIATQHVEATSSTTERLMDRLRADVAEGDRVSHRGRSCVYDGCTSDGQGVILHLADRPQTKFAITKPETLERFAAENGVLFDANRDKMAGTFSQKTNTNQPMSLLPPHLTHQFAAVSAKPQRAIFKGGPSEMGPVSTVDTASMSRESVRSDPKRKELLNASYANLNGKTATVTLAKTPDGKPLRLNVRKGIDPCDGAAPVVGSKSAGESFVVQEARTFANEKGVQHVWGKIGPDTWVALGVVGGALNVSIAGANGVDVGNQRTAAFDAACVEPVAGPFVPPATATEVVPPPVAPQGPASQPEVVAEVPCDITLKPVTVDPWSNHPINTNPVLREKALRIGKYLPDNRSQVDGIPTDSPLLKFAGAESKAGNFPNMHESQSVSFDAKKFKEAYGDKVVLDLPTGYRLLGTINDQENRDQLVQELKLLDGMGITEGTPLRTMIDGVREAQLVGEKGALDIAALIAASASCKDYQIPLVVLEQKPSGDGGTDGQGGADCSADGGGSGGAGGGA